jgi:cytochrome c biogenesis protein CcmG, thiol:disulfide interchange protein DsbE
MRLLLACTLVTVLLGCNAQAGPAARVGERVVDYQGPTLTGDTFRLRTGAPTLLNVWATWCAPCREEMPELQLVYERHRAAGLRVVGVTTDVRAAEPRVRSFVREVDVHFTIVLDPEDRIGSVILVPGMPTTVLLDRNGRIVWRHLGAVTADMPSLVTAITEVLEDSDGRRES